jgi:hypothetical protein
MKVILCFAYNKKKDISIKIIIYRTNILKNLYQKQLKCRLYKLFTSILSEMKHSKLFIRRFYLKK